MAFRYVDFAAVPELYISSILPKKYLVYLESVWGMKETDISILTGRSVD